MGYPTRLCYFTHRLSARRRREEQGIKASFLGILHPQDDPRWDRFLFEVNQLFSIPFQSVLVECDGLEGLRGGDVKSPIDTASYDTFNGPSRVFESDESPEYESL